MKELSAWAELPLTWPGPLTVSVPWVSASACGTSSKASSRRSGFHCPIVIPYCAGRTSVGRRKLSPAACGDSSTWRWTAGWPSTDTSTCSAVPAGPVKLSEADRARKALTYAAWPRNSTALPSVAGVTVTPPLEADAPSWPSTRPEAGSTPISMRTTSAAVPEPKLSSAKRTGLDVPGTMGRRAGRSKALPSGATTGCTSVT